MLKSKILRTDHEFNLYQDKFMKSLGPIAEKTQKIPLDYFQRSHVVGYYDRSGEMVAGFILCKAHPLRLLGFVPNVEELPLPKVFSFNECQEIVCLWKEKSVPKYVTHNSLWPDIMTAFLASGSKFLLGHTQSEKLYKHYDLMSPAILYEGPSVFNLPSRLFYYTKFQAHALRASSHVLSLYFRLKR